MRFELEIAGLLLGIGAVAAAVLATGAAACAAVLRFWAADSGETA